MTPAHSPTLSPHLETGVMAVSCPEKQSHGEVRNPLPVAQQVGLRAGVGTHLYFTSKPLSQASPSHLSSCSAPELTRPLGCSLEAFPTSSYPTVYDVLSPQHGPGRTEHPSQASEALMKSSPAPA